MSGSGTTDDERAAWEAIVADLSGEIDVTGILPVTNDATPAGEVHVDEVHVDEDAVHLDDPEDFIPPDPPLPRTDDVVARFAWAAVLGGPALMVLVYVLSLGRFLAGVGAVLAVAGFITLIIRRKERSHDERWGDDHYGDGAVV